MVRRLAIAVSMTGYLILGLGGTAAAQHDAHGGEATAAPTSGAELPEYVAKAIELHPMALGAFTRPIASKNAEAQAFFDQGLQMMYGSRGSMPSARSARRGSATPSAPSATGVKAGPGART
jgi:hypothetical protein